MSEFAIFISYSHDSGAHRERVLALAERLRADGLDAQLDRYVNGTPTEGWPRWMLNRLDGAAFVLVVCSETYYRRFRGHEAPDKGKGADWEGALITQEIYDSKSTTVKFVPVMLTHGQADFIPEPLRKHTHYVLTEDDGYDALYAFLRGAAGVDARPLGKLKPLERKSAQPLSFDDAGGAERHPSNFGLPAHVVLWSSLSLVIGAAFLALTSALFKWPFDGSTIFRRGVPSETAKLDESEEVTTRSKAAEMALLLNDYEQAWGASVEAVRLFPSSEAAQHAQSTVAMAWLRDVHVPESKTIADIVDPLLACLTRRAASATGRAGADVLAHIGWGYFLKSRADHQERDVEQQYQRALVLDSDNPYAHAMWGHWILWNRGPLSEARTHFVAALKSDRARVFARELQLASLQAGSGHVDSVVELLRVLNDMRKNGEPLTDDDRDRALRGAYFSNREVVEAQLTSITSASEHLATFEWLSEGASDNSGSTHMYWLARLTEANRDGTRALALYLKAIAVPSVFAQRIRDGIGRCTGGGDGAIPVLLQSLGDPDASVRATAVRSIEALRPDTARVMPALVAALRDSDSEVRANAAHALGAIGPDPAEVVPALIQSLRDPVQEVRGAAAGSLVALGEPAVPALILALRDLDPRVRRNAARALGEIATESESAVSALTALLGDLDAEVRAAAAQALGELGARAKGAVPALATLVRGDRDEKVLHSAIYALGNMGSDARAAVPALCEALSAALEDADDSGGFRGAVIANALGRIGPDAKDSFDVLMRALESDHLRVPNAAASALGRLGAHAKGAIPALLELMARTEKQYRDNQAEPLAKIAVALRDSGDTASIDALKSILRAFQTAEVNPERIADVDDAIDVLRAGERAKQ